MTLASKNLQSTDALIVGSGAAGLYCAIKAHDHGLNTVIVSKSLLTRGGCSRMSGIHWSPLSYKSSNDLISEVKRNFEQFGPHLKLVDLKLLKSIVAYGPKAIQELERMGVYWKRTSDGQVVTTGPSKSYPIAARRGETGSSTMNALLMETMRRRIRFREEAVVTSILTKAGFCVGATCLDIRTGDFFVVGSKCVILATGHAGGYLWRYSTNTRDCTGDGISLAYRAGAEIMNIEFQGWHSHDNVYPESSRRLIHLGSVAEGARIVTKDGKLLNEEIAKETRSEDIIHHPDVAKVIAERFPNRGDLYVSYAQDKASFLEDRYQPIRAIRKLGYDITNDLIPVGMQPHTSYGGIRVDSHCQTNIKGLFAIGGVAGQYPTVLQCLWGGETVASYASKQLKDQEVISPDVQQVEEERNRINSLLVRMPSEGLSPARVKRMIRDLMWEKMWYLKSQKDMSMALIGIRAVRTDAKRKMGVESLGRQYNSSWQEAIEVFNMLDVCELMIRASLDRCESRGCFQRLDFPRTDDENWFKRIVLKLHNGEIEIQYAPADLMTMLEEDSG